MSWRLFGKCWLASYTSCRNLLSLIWHFSISTSAILRNFEASNCQPLILCSGMVWASWPLGWRVFLRFGLNSKFLWMIPRGGHRRILWKDIMSKVIPVWQSISMINPDTSYFSFPPKVLKFSHLVTCWTCQGRKHRHGKKKKKKKALAVNERQQKTVFPYSYWNEALGNVVADRVVLRVISFTGSQ